MKSVLLGRGSLLALDQVLSSVSNLLMGVVAIRSLGLSDFGAFSIVYVAYILVLGVVRAAFADPYMAGIYARDEENDRHELIAVFSLVGLVFGAAAAAALFVTDRASAPVAGGLVVLLMALFTFDAIRYIGFKVPAMWVPCTADFVWVVALAVAAFVLPDDVSVGGVLLVWAAAGAAGLLAALPLMPRPNLRLALPRSLRTHRKVRVAFAVDFALSSGVGQLAALLLGAFFGLAALGSFRAVSLVMRPATTAVTAVQSVLLNEFDVRSQREGGTVFRFAHVVAFFLLSISVVWSVFVLAIPDDWLVDLLGPDWLRAKNLVLPVAVLNFGLVAIVPAQLLLRYRRHSRHLLMARLVASVMLLAGLFVGDIVAAVRAAVWGMAIGALAGAATFWYAAYLPRVGRKAEGRREPVNR